MDASTERRRPWRRHDLHGTASALAVMLALLPAPAWAAGDAGSCAALGRMLPAHTVLDAAPALVADGEAAAGGTRLPAHCLLRGTIDARTGVGGVPFGSKFELRMPVAWNDRFMFQGGGGTDGAVLPAYGDRNQPAGNVPALAQGFAVVTTDGGHEDNDSSFGLDPKARTDWGYDSVAEVTQAAKQLVARFYGHAAAYSYLVGCSNGGRQGMMMSQRYPGDYDGIVAGDPVFRLSRSHIASAWDIQTFTAVAPPGADGRPVLAQAFSDAELRLVSDAMLAQCDALDGLRDGLVSNPAACRFDPAKLQCWPGPPAPGEPAACLSPAKVSALRRYFAGPHDSHGRALYASWPWDPGIASANWRAWKLGTATGPVPNAIKAGLSNNAIRFLMLTPPQPDFTEAAFDFDRDPARMRAAAAFADATSPDLAAFRAHGGKIILYHGLADPAISAHDTERYYDDLVRAQGGLRRTQEFARLFEVPGMTHCTGGTGLDSFDTVGAIVAWVEHRTPPARIVARGGAMPGITRPLCPYPASSRYPGTGPTADAASFKCL